MVKKVAAHASAVIKGILFIGFSIQIILGIVWMCCNFTHIQDFPAPDTTLYLWLFRIVGECAPVMYVLQLASAFAVGYFFLQNLMPVGRLFAVWRALALLTFPFAMQCHLALQPHSFVGTLFLGVLLFAVKAIRVKHHRKLTWGVCLLCATLLVGMTGVLDRENREIWLKRGIEGSIASRFAWYTAINDMDGWGSELLEIVEDVGQQVSFTPGNMEVLFETIEAQVEPQQAREYYRHIAEYAWSRRKPIIIRQMAGDVLGYTLSPVLVQMQLDGTGYDSYTGRNYENMRNAYPLLTGRYVNYGCWWFVMALGCCVVESVLLRPASRVENRKRKELCGRKEFMKRVILPAGFCVLLSGIWVFILTFRGAGLMDYKWSIAVNELWLIWAMLSMGKMRTEEDALDSEKSE